jgi:hypothetical protein
MSNKVIDERRIGKKKNSEESGLDLTDVYHGICLESLMKAKKIRYTGRESNRECLEDKLRALSIYLGAWIFQSV